MTLRISVKALSGVIGFVILLASTTVNVPARASGTDTSANSSRDDWQRSRIVPLVAYHQHLLSPAASELISPPKEVLPSIVLPAELQALIAKREAMNGSASAADVYAADAQITRPNGGNWARDGEAVQKSSGAYEGAHFRPNGFSVSSDSGFIAGTVRWETSAEDSMNFLWALRRFSGAWRIAAESITPIAPPVYPRSITADDLIQEMDDAGIRRGVILSTAYFFGSPMRHVDNEYEKLRADNDWTIEQAQRYPGRLVVFCGVNPLRDYAIQELERCSKIPVVRGMKLHFGNSRVDVTNPEHLSKVQNFFRAANMHRMALVVHLWTGNEYGSKQAHIFLDNLLPEAPDVTIQIAHMAGAGPGYEDAEDNALAVYAEAIGARDPRMKNVYFDITTNIIEEQKPEVTQLIAKRLRQIGLQHVLFGSDMSLRSNPPVGEQWATVRHKLPLSDAELKIIASNVAPYMNE